MKEVAEYFGVLQANVVPDRETDRQTEGQRSSIKNSIYSVCVRKTQIDIESRGAVSLQWNRRMRVESKSTDSG